MINKLDWDSTFYGLEIAEYFIDTQSLLDIQYKYDLIYVLCETGKEIILKGYSESYKENKIIYFKKLFNLNELDKKEVISFSKTNFSRDELYNLAFESGKYSRFKKDKKFSNQQFENLYIKWIDNSLDFNFADDILIYVEENKIVGFIIKKWQFSICHLFL